MITVTRARSFGRHQISSENAPWLDPIQIIDFLKHFGGLEVEGIRKPSSRKRGVSNPHYQRTMNLLNYLHKQTAVGHIP